MTRLLAALAAFGLLLAACGDDSDAGATATTEPAETTTTRPLRTLQVRIAAETSGLGACATSTARAGNGIGNGERLTVEDQDGTRLGVATMNLTRGAGSCDWTVGIAGVPADADLYTLTAGDDLITLRRGELEQVDWQPILYVDVGGSVELYEP